MAINLYEELVHDQTVLEIFEKYKIPKDIDLLSVDTDYADYWIIEKILTQYKPKVIIHEINQQPLDTYVSVPKVDYIVITDKTNYFGANICAYYCLAKINDYSMMYCESAGVNCFWIRNDLIKNNLKLDVPMVQKILNPNFLFRKAAFVYSETAKKWFDVERCY
jgi:hypothetical protein